MKVIITLVVVFLAGLASIHCNSDNPTSSQPPGANRSNDSRSKSEMTEDDVKHLIASLDSDNENIRGRAQTDLVNFAQASPETRKVVINQVVLVVRHLRSNDRRPLDQKAFVFWLSANQLFRRLQATEAIDLLISYIAWSDGFAGNGDHQPAQYSLIMMGDSAVPKLSEALLKDADPLTRGLVAKCLGNIGGQRAKLALEQAERTETHKEVIQYIQAALTTIAREP